MTDPAGPPPDRSSRLIWALVAGAIVALILARYAPGWRARFAPSPTAAHVVLLVDGQQVATDGAHRLPAGTSFRLYVVLEAETAGGGTIWYTDAPAVRLGGRDLPADALERWPESRRAAVRWLTVDPFAPYAEIANPSDLERVRSVETLHGEWGTGWSAQVVVDPRSTHVDPELDLRPLGFGVQRFAARVELYESAESLTPSARWSSPGAEAFEGDRSLVPSVVATRAAPFEAISASAGRIQLEPAADLPAAALARVDELVGAGVAFVGSRLLAEHLERAGVAADRLEFRTVELGPEGPLWQSQVLPGDLLRAGDRLVILERDAGVPGRLDPADVVFDLHRGLRLLPVARAFRGEGTLRLDLAPVAARAPAGLGQPPAAP